ncbi:MAG: hypothetical protein MJA83_13275, partial [Gammaproteobacteria bacterium]|nr:hypothetical protein [Gammaproteobacteria bacterium]
MAEQSWWEEDKEADNWWEEDGVNTEWTDRQGRPSGFTPREPETDFLRGANVGLAQTLGTPVDAATSALDLLGVYDLAHKQGLIDQPGPPPEQFLGSDYFQRIMSKGGMAP